MSDPNDPLPPEFQIGPTNLQAVADIIECEGFEYAFCSYSDFEDIEDAEFHRLRRAFIQAAKALRVYVNERSAE